MDIRTAILKAADHIERDPTSMNFCHGHHPDKKALGVCPLAWIGFYLGLDASKAYLGVDEMYASTVAIKLNGSPDIGLFFEQAGNAISSPSTAPAVLRAYADKYHPAAEMPASVRRIFQWTGEQRERFADMC